MLKYLKCDKKDLVDFLSVFFSEEISDMNLSHFQRLPVGQRKEKCDDFIKNDLSSAHTFGCISSVEYLEKLTAARKGKN